MNLDMLLNTLVSQRGSDLHLQVGLPPIVRIEGQLRFFDRACLTKADIDTSMELMDIRPEYMGRLNDELSTDFKYTSAFNQNFRVNIAMTSDWYKLTFRNLNKKVPDLDNLGYRSGIFDEILKMQHGLVILTGPTNSGKSTTLASLMQRIATFTPKNIITMEDPIEYIFDKGNSIVTRRELGISFLDYPMAIHDAMREDPDVIMVGEMRDAETIRATILAAETGHLVLSSMHNNTLNDAKERMLLTMRPEERNLIEIALEKSLRFMMSQRLVYSEIDKKLHVEYDYKYY